MTPIFTNGRRARQRPCERSSGRLWAWAIWEDVDAPQAPLPENTVYYGLSTVAQSAAALAAMLGAFGLWQLERLLEVDRADEQQEDQIKRELFRDRLDMPHMESWHQLRLTVMEHHRLEIAFASRVLRRALVVFLLGTLAILVLAIAGLAFVETLCALARTVRLWMILASLGLGIGPTVVVGNAVRVIPPAVIHGREVSRLGVPGDR
jgi:hypothetical protein